MEALAMIRHAFGEESMSHTRKCILTKSEKGETNEDQSQEHAHYFL
jgi:hypothetical protein